jgi:hypothetical protein
VVGGGASPAVVQKKTLRASEQDRPDVAARRRIWQAARLFVDPYKLVFIDETGASTKMTRLYGRAPRGRRLFAKAPFGHWKITTFVAALRRDGLGASMVLDGPMTCQAFLAYVEVSVLASGGKSTVNARRAECPMTWSTARA